MDVRTFRQRGRINLCHGPEQDEMPVRPQLRGTAQEIDIEAFIQHAEEPEPGMRDPDLVGGLRLGQSSAGEVRHVHATGKGVYIRVTAALDLVERMAAGEDHIGTREQLFLEFDQQWRSASKERQLVHAVVGGRQRREVAREGQRHRRVVPDHVAGQALAFKERIQHSAYGVVAEVGGQMRCGDSNAACSGIE